MKNVLFISNGLFCPPPSLKQVVFKMAIILSCFAVWDTPAAQAQIPTQCTNPDCNLVCFGDFEDFTPEFNTYHSQLGVSAFGILNSQNPVNTVDVGTDADDNNQILRWIRLAGPNGSNNFEVPRIPLSEPIPNGCSALIQYRATASVLTGSSLPQPFISIWGLSGAPCATIIAPSCSAQQYQLCSNPVTMAYQLSCESIPLDQGVTGNGTDYQGLDFQTYTISVTNNSGAPITDLLLYGESTASGLYTYQFFVDDLSVSAPCACDPPSAFVCACTGANTLNIAAGENGTSYALLEAIHNYDKNDDGVLDNSDHNGCIAITGRLIVDENLSITNCTDMRMQPCAEIVVNAQRHLNMTQNVIYGCRLMWQGITVNQFGRLTFSNNEIRDAEHAILANGSGFTWPVPPNGVGVTTISVFRNRFIQNHIGVWVQGTAGASNINHMPFVQNTFVGGGYPNLNLRQPCTFGLPNWNLDNGYAGLVVQNTDFVAGIAGDATSTNSFTALRNGAIAEGCNFQMHEGSFTDLVGELNIMPNANIPSFLLSEGIGVLSTSGSATVSNSVFSGCGHGIFSRNGRLTANNNDITDVGRGIEAFSPYRFDIINNRDIIYRDRGIFAQNFNVIPFFGLSSYMIRGNYLRNQVTGLELGTRAILMDNAVVQDILNARMFDNDILLSVAGSGIRVRNQNQWTIDENRVRIKDLSGQDQNGGTCFDFQNSRRDKIISNTVSSEGINPSTRAFQIANSPENNFCCNYTEGTTSGFEFFGACLATAFRTSDMFAHDRTLFLSNNTTIGEQGPLIPGSLNYGNYGNLFNVTSGNAVNDAALVSGILSNRFHVISDQTPDFPEVVLTPNLTGAPDWFEDNGIGEFECTDCETLPVPDGERGRMLDEADRITAGPGFGTSTAGERMLQWENARHLYQRMREYPELHNQETVIDSFFTAASGGTLHAYFVADSLANGVSVVSDTVSTILVDAMESADATDSLVESAMTPLSTAVFWADSLTIYRMADSIRLTGADEQLTFQQALIQAKIGRATKAQQALIYVSNLSATNILEQNRKDALRLFLKSIGQDVYTLSAGEIDTLSDIAHQCPAEGGSAVYIARALYVQLIEEKMFSDDTLCATEERALRKAETKHTDTYGGIQLTPNPASHELTVSGLSALQAEQRIELINVAGVTVLEHVIPSGATSAQLSVGSLPQGVYQCRISDGREGVQTHKLLILR